MKTNPQMKADQRTNKQTPVPRKFGNVINLLLTDKGPVFSRTFVILMFNTVYSSGWKLSDSSDKELLDR